MKRQASNILLKKAKKSKNDEFYTQLCDIERELQHYPNCFKNKVVYCNCDYPRTSNFYRFFRDNFHSLGLRKLIASCYKEISVDLFSQQANERAFYCTYKGQEDSERTFPFKGDGDFRSPECLELLEQSDIVVTNPPFSLFREFVSQIVRHNKQFLIIGNVNAITYKEIFNLIQKKQCVVRREPRSWHLRLYSS